MQKANDLSGSVLCLSGIFGYDIICYLFPYSNDNLFEKLNRIFPICRDLYSLH